MLDRCRNNNNTCYKYYGVRGISVCNDWLIFENFLKDTGYAPDKHQLDRIDNDGNYKSRNCRWVSRSVQCRNRRSNRLITFIGITLPLKTWSDFLCINPKTLKSRLDNDWDFEVAFGLKI